MRIKILHTSDWHLGKKLFKISRHAEQKILLDFFINKIEVDSIDLLLISGDIFDSPNPPVESIKLFYDFLRNCINLNCHVAIIAGNHDSGRLLTLPSTLIDNNKIIISGELEGAPATLLFQKDGLKIQVDLIPYFRSFELKGDNDPIIALKKVVDEAKDLGADIKIAMVHHQIGSFEFSGSEYGLSLSGVESLPLQIFDRYDYLALGHIHKKMVISNKKPIAIYPGSPIPMRFSEHNEKSYIQLEVSKEGLEYEIKPIPIIRHLHSIKSSATEIISAINNVPITGSLLGPLFEVVLTEEHHITGISDQVRKAVNEKGGELLSFQINSNFSVASNENSIDLREISLEKHFDTFYFDRFQKNPPTEIINLFKELLNESMNHENQSN